MSSLPDIPDRRARLYLLLAVPFEFPEPRRIDKLIHGSWGKAVQTNVEALGLCGQYEDFPLRLEATFEEYEVEFIKLFEVGLGGAPCPLHSGYYARDRMKDLEEVVRFYRYFDFAVARTADRLHDHLVFELQFMAHLIQREGAGLEEYGSLRLAQSDFLERHLANWVPGLLNSIKKRSDIPFTRGVAGLLAQFINEERDCLYNEVRQQVQNV